MKIKILTILSLLSLFMSDLSAQDKFHDPLLGRNVYVFDPSMDPKEIQAVLDTLFAWQTVRGSEFSKNRFAILFKPGNYELDVRIDYYMSALGLGISPGEVVIKGAVRSNTTHGKSVLTNFWRSVENLTIIPSGKANVWGVSQAAPMRRIHVKGDLQLFDVGYASGGFLSDSKVDGVITSGPQQQWFSRNCEIGSWNGGVWNMMFLGVKGAPEEKFPDNSYTTINETPVIREKPYLVSTANGYSVCLPPLRKASTGVSWETGSDKGELISLDKFYVAKPEKDNAASLNKALKSGKNILFTPGIYRLEESLKVDRKGTVILGIGVPSLMPVKGNAAIETADAGGISISGITMDAGEVKSGSLFVVGEPGSGKSNGAEPIFLYDIFFRVGGPIAGSTDKCMVINSSNVYVDHTWIWRADHGAGADWDVNRSENGLVVNGANVTVYGLFNEHHQGYQTLWNGEKGRVYFYQSEMPYDPPSADAWKHDGISGYASYKVADHVQDHEAWGLGIYNVFYDAPVIVDNAIEVPAHLERKIHNKIIFWLNGNKESIVKSIINGKGGQVDVKNRKAAMR